MASRSMLLNVIAMSLFVCPAVLRADKIQITSEPPGASVEIDGKTNTTPCEIDFPRSYFRDPHSLLSKHLNHPIVARFTRDGYLPKELPLTEGPMEWVSASGHKRYQYWLFRSSYFHVDLDVAGEMPKKLAVGQFESQEPRTWIQTDASVNPGNNGGPLLNFARRSNRNEYAEGDQARCERHRIRIEH